MFTSSGRRTQTTLELLYVATNTSLLFRGHLHNNLLTHDTQAAVYLQAHHNGTDMIARAMLTEPTCVGQ